MKKYLFLFSLCLLSGCMVGPDYSVPETYMPAKFIESKDNAPLSDEELCSWWKQFMDPLLDSLIEETIASNFDYQIALEKMFQARAEYQIEGSYLWPEIDLNAQATRSRFSQTIATFSSGNLASTAGDPNLINSGTPSNLSMLGARISPIQNFFQIGFDAIWELDFWGKFRRNKQAAFDLWQASGFTAQIVLITVISEVARDYVSIRALQNQIALLKKKIRADEEELRLTQDLFKSGLDSEIQFDDLIVILENDKATLEPLETALKQTIYALAVLLGKQPEQLASTFEDVKPVPVGLDRIPSGLPSELLRRRPDIREAERQLAAATEQIGVNVANLFPHISLTGNNYGYETSKFNQLFRKKSTFWRIGPSINWDLLDFGRTTGQIAVAQSLQRQAFLTYEQTVISSLEDVEGALVAYFEEQRRNIQLATAEAAERRTYELTNDLYQSGLASGLQLLNVLKVLIDAENALILSNQALTSDLIAVYKALGGDWECTCTP